MLGLGAEQAAPAGADGIGLSTIISAALPVLGSALGFGTKFWAAGEVREAQKKALIQTAKQREIEARALRLQRLQQQKAAVERQMIEAQALEVARASQRRQETVLALYAVGGVAVAIGSIFVIQTLRRAR